MPQCDAPHMRNAFTIGVKKYQGDVRQSHLCLKVGPAQAQPIHPGQRIAAGHRFFGCLGLGFFARLGALRAMGLFLFHCAQNEICASQKRRTVLHMASQPRQAASNLAMRPGTTGRAACSKPLANKQMLGNILRISSSVSSSLRSAKCGGK